MLRRLAIAARAPIADDGAPAAAAALPVGPTRRSNGGEGPPDPNTVINAGPYSGLTVAQSPYDAAYAAQYGSEYTTSPGFNAPVQPSLSPVAGGTDDSGGVRHIEPVARSVDVPATIFTPKLPAPTPPTPAPIVDAAPAAAPAAPAAPATTTLTTTPGDVTQTTPAYATQQTPATSLLLPQSTLDALAAQLGAGAGGGGFTSPDMAAGVPSTAGLQEIQPVAASTATSTNPALALLIVGGLAAAGIFLWLRLRKKKPAAAPPAAPEAA